MAQNVPQVRKQYEQYPYPPRDPSNEKTWLITTWLDDLAMINHYCFAGQQTFQDRFRVLVAGGGTGDATIFLAHQLRDTNAEIVHVDISLASIEIARRRADVRNLGNITWIHASLLAVPELQLEKFDYINCVGVLHHLEDPDAGLRALLAVLKDRGAMAIMVYGKYGRTGVYQMQSLMRLINQGISDTKTQITNTKEVLETIPTTNWFKRGEELIIDHKQYGDTGIYDIFLHACDRAYTVGEVYEWFHDRHALHLEFTCNMRGRSVYLPEMVVGRTQPRFLNAVRTLPARQRHEIAELLGGTLITHTFYVTHTPDAKAAYGNPDHVPFFFCDATGEKLSEMIRRNKRSPLMVNHTATGLAMTVDPGKFGKSIVKYIDGKRQFDEIFSMVRAEPEFHMSLPSDDELFLDFRSIFDCLSAIDRILLRHRDVQPVGHDGSARSPQLKM